MVAKPLCPLYKYIIKPLDRAYYPELRSISVGYRVKSIQGTCFRQWATERLNEYIVKGFTMDDERLKNLGGGNYWKELLDRTRDCHEKINKKKENLAREIGTHIEKNACLFS